MVKVLIHGSNGKMGGILIDLLRNGACGCELLCGVDAVKKGNEDYNYYQSFDQVKEIPDVIIDFSFHTLIGQVLDYAVKINRPVVVATTGATDEEKAKIYEAAKKVPVFFSANMSVGIALLVDFAKKAAENFPDADIEIVEAHHNRKVDAPSGTAMMLAEGVKSVRPKANFVFGRSGECKRKPDDIGIHALRMANIVGEHTVYVTTSSQQLALKHNAYDRGLFADGAIKAAAFIAGKAAGLYDMYSYLGK